MAAARTLHPSDQTLHAYGSGQLDGALVGSVDSHLESCPDCRRRVAELSSSGSPGRHRDAGAQPASQGPALSGIDGLVLPGGGAAMPASTPASAEPLGLADHPDYRVLRELGRGGMGVVYLAENKLMGRKEVLKVLSSHLISRPAALDRFLREIRNAAQLHHPNIVTAFAALRVGEGLVLAMEYVEGFDLARVVKANGPLPAAHACNYVQQAALGLQHAFEHGMVHRDIKPGNLMLARQSNRALIKVLDFGLAKVQSEGPVAGGLTHEGQMLGTPDYVAPEQIRNARNADIRADIYSLGCTLYYLLTAGPPFQGTSLYDILQAHHSMDATPLNLVRPDVPVEVAAIAAKMMAKEPEQRFQEPREVARALEPFFKKGSAASVGSKPDLSRATPPELKHKTAGTGPVLDRTLVESEPASLPPGRPPGMKAQPVPAWESMVDFKATEPSPAAAPAVASRRLPPWTWPAAAVGVLLLGLMSLWGTGVIKIKTPEGVIVLRNLPEGATVLVDGKKATVQWPEGGSPAEITTVPGDHLVEVKKDGLTMRGQTVTVEKDGRTTLMVEFEPLERPDVAENHPSRPEPDKPEMEREKPSGTVDTRQAETQRPQAETAGRWVSLFNGQNFNGWHFEGDDPGPWGVEDGVIVARGQDFRTRNYLLTNREFTDFALRLEFNMGEGAGSGIAIRALPGDRMPMPNGNRIYDHPLLKLIGTPGREETGTTHWVLASMNVKPDRPAEMKPAGSWNLLEVEVRSQTMRASVNGKPILNTRLDPGAVFPDGTVPGLGRAKGRIGLQKHTNTVRFRSIEVQDLSSRPEQFSGTVEPKSAPDVADFFQPGSVWGVDSHRDQTLTVLERQGERFKALFVVGRQVREVKGTIKDGRLHWLARDVKAIAGNPGGDNEGVIKGGVIEMTWSDPGGPVRGHFTFRLKESAPASSATGREKVAGTIEGDRQPTETKRGPEVAATSRVARPVPDGDLSWRVEGQELVQSEGAGTLFLGDASFSSFDMKFKAMIVSGQEGFVAIFHHTSDKDYRFFHVGESRQKKVVSGFMYRGQEGGDGPKNVPVKLRQWYDVRIKVRDSEYWCYLDYEQIFHGVGPDARFTKGRIGLATWDAKARFRDIVVTSPEGKVLWQGPPELAR
jgi:serine/threonine protein kinase